MSILGCDPAGVVAEATWWRHPAADGTPATPATVAVCAFAWQQVMT